MSGSRSLFAMFDGLAALAVAGPAAAENVLRFTGQDAWAATMDPHSYSIRRQQGATHQVYEALLDIDSNLAIVPQLAVAWKILDPTHWEFELRQGVRFHDGTPFTAEDVVFSIERARAETSELPGATWPTSRAVEAIDDHTVHITTMVPDPLLWMRLGRSPSCPKPGRRRTTSASRRTSTRAKRPLPHATPTAPGRSCSRSSSRAAAGDGPQSELVGHRELPPQHRPHRVTPIADPAAPLSYAILGGTLDRPV